ncbi:ATP-binding protein [Pseudonocardia xinjiangensis]|uniref:ATP-binding protein n=1 Tax=Pseudonocardia xinjiangensis TaxID=75289 RepID=UPI003D8FD332
MADGGPGGWSRHRALPAEPVAPRAAREVVRGACRDWHLDQETCDDAVLVATELVANVVDHAHTSCVLTVSRAAAGLRIDVRDFSASPLPELRPVDVRAPRGRGLQVVAAVSAAWGVVTDLDGGKSVWAVVANGAAP